MNIEKIDVKKINIITVVNDRFTKSTVEMLLEQQLFFANKINEIIDVLNEKQKDCYCSYGYSCKNCCDRQEQEAVYIKNDWEKEFDKIFQNKRQIYLPAIKQFIRNLLK